MSFEKVHVVWDYYDGVRSGIADFGGAPHYFASLFDDRADAYSDRFQLFPVDADFIALALRQWTIFRAWEARFHRGLVPLETHPGHGGVDAEYDDLSRRLDEQIKTLDPTSALQAAIFRAVPGQEELPAGVLRELEVAWSPATA